MLIQVSDLAQDDIQPDLRVDRPCKVVAEVVNALEGDDVITLILRVLQASDPEMLSRIHAESLRKSASNDAKYRQVRRRLTRFATELKLLPKDKLGGKEPVQVDFSDAAGRKVVLDIARRSFKDSDGKTVSSLAVGFLDVWALDDESGPDRAEWSSAAEEATA